MASRKNGTILPTIISDATDVPITGLVRKYSGTPVIPAAPKPISCLFVRLSATFVLIPDRFFGTGTEIAIFMPSFLQFNAVRHFTAFHQ